MSDEVIDIVRSAADAPGRIDLWERVLRGMHARAVCEVGVFRGAFAEHVLRACPDIERYMMIDPWRHLPDWNKPANKNDAEFREIFEEAMARTESFSSKRVVLRDPTIAAAQSIAEGSLDAIYIDGDHTLRGITIDLIRMLPKVREGGIIGGDDFTRSIWQHGMTYAPTEVFPFAVHFAEATGLPIVTLPYNQFCIVNDRERGFEVIDLGQYGALEPSEIYAQPRASGWRTLRRRLARRLPASLKANLKSRLRRHP
jgi:hypothetical protein